MPDFGVSEIIALIGTAVAAAGTGAQLAGVGQPSQGAERAAALKQEQEAQQKQAQLDAQNRQKAVFANLANAQEQTGGAVSGGGLVNLASVIAGLPGAATDTTGQKALAQYLGNPPSEQGQNLVGQTFGLSGSQG